MSQHNNPPQPPKPVPYPVYSQEEIDRRLLAVIRYILSIPEERLAPKKHNSQTCIDDAAAGVIEAVNSQMAD